MKKYKVRCLKSGTSLFLHEQTNTLIAIQADEVIFATSRENVEFIYHLFGREMSLRQGAVISKDVWTPHLGKLYRRTEKGFEVKIPEKFWRNVFSLAELEMGTRRQTVPTPFVTEVIFQPQPLSAEALHSYRTLTGKLMRAGGERPELLYAIQELRRHFDAKQSDFAAAKRLALYLRGTLEKVLQLEADGPFCDL